MKSSSLIIMVILLLFVTAIMATGEEKACACAFNHLPPPSAVNDLPDKIGEYAGYGALGEFMKQGGFNCPENILKQIRAMNETYQEDEYTPRYDEAKAIQQWLTAIHVIYTPPESPVTCPVCGVAHTWAQYRAMVMEKVARRDEITTEIDTIAEKLQLDAWELIPDASKAAFMESLEE
jgi:hypothetical protein